MGIMNNRICVLFCCVCIIFALNANALSQDCGELLFSNAKFKLTRSEQEQICNFMASYGIKFSSTKNGFVDDSGDGDIVTLSTQSINLSNGGQRGIFIVGGNTYTSGVTGSSIWAFILNKNGLVQSEFGFPAVEFKLLNSVHLNFHDIQFFGSGFCAPIWIWNGHNYIFQKSMTMKEAPNNIDCSNPN